MTSDLKLKQFNLNKIKPGKVVCIIGRRGSGKTTLVKDILYNHRRIPTATLFGGAYDLACHFPSSFVMEHYDPIVVSSILTRSRRLKTVPTITVFDDCMFNKRAFSSDLNFREILMNGRHYAIMLILTMQYAMDLGPDLRSQFDYVFVFKDNILQNIERLWRSFFGVVDTLDDFRNIMREVTDNFNCHVIDNTSTSNRLEDILFFYCAEQHAPNFKVGGKQYWQYHYLHRRDSGLDDEEDEEEHKLVRVRPRK